MADDAPVNFSLSEALRQYTADPLRIETEAAPSELIECEHEPESLTLALVNSVLNPVVDAIATSPEAILVQSRFDTIQFLLKNSSQIPHATLSKVVDLLTSALSTQAEHAYTDLRASEEDDAISQHKQLLEIYGFLLQWAVAAVKAQTPHADASAPARGRGKGAKAKTGGKDGNFDASAQLVKSLAAMHRVLQLHEGLSRIFLTTPDRDAFVEMFTKSIWYGIFETEANIKNTAIREHSFRVLCIAIKHHGHEFAAQTAIEQMLTQYEHLAEPMAEFLQILTKEFDHPQLAENVLRYLGDKEYSSTDTKGPKAASVFLTRISEVLPELVYKQLVLLAKILNSESYALRNAIIDICGNMIIMHSKNPDFNDSNETAIEALFSELEPRFRDVNPYCRSRTMQAYVKICKLERKFPRQRLHATKLAAKSLEDKSSIVRRNAIKLLSELVSTHPHTWKGEAQNLSLQVWKQWEEETLKQITELMPPEELQANAELDEPTANASLIQDATQVENATQDDPEEPAAMTKEQEEAELRNLAEQMAVSRRIEELQELGKAAKRAVTFIELVEEAAEIISQLLSSKNKTEVIEAMDFFKLIDAFRIQAASAGIRRMLRLVWAKGNSDEGKGIQSHLIECYKELYFNAPPGYSPDDTARYVARNMISLTFGTTPAELTCLEQLLSIMMKQKLVSNRVIEKLWLIYDYQKKEGSKTQRRGAIIVLGMLALADSQIIRHELVKCLRIGLGSLGRRDLGLARYTCIALRRISAPPGKQSPDTTPEQVLKFDSDHEVLAKLSATVEVVSDSKEWFGVAEQAIGAIYALAKHPDVVCSDILRRKTKSVFAPHARVPQAANDASMASDDHAAPSEDGDVEMEDAPPLKAEPEAQPVHRQQNPAAALSQLLFIVGHVAIKQIVHLELCELEFKRRKAEEEKKKKTGESVAPENPSPVKRGKKKSSGKEKTPAPEEADDLDQIGGTTEDDFTDIIQGIRENELLHGANSLLAKFGPMVREICANNTSYNHPTLQAQAALCMAKLMCVSQGYCEENLELLIVIMNQSKDAVVRSNLVLALGDMAVCFNQLIDDNTDILYAKLRDSDPSVKRTCLMTLTFLILAGQIKVKGQLSEMAKCLEDSDKKIADMTRMFFSELSTKDNAIYNQFVDMFSVLGADPTLSEDVFRKIIKFLATYIEKDKHAKQLATKLAARLPHAEDQRQWDNTTYALGLLKHNDEDIQKVVTEGFKVVQTQA